jgi:hypothetical protein
MKVRKSGDRHPLLLTRRTFDRVWRATLLLGLTLLAVWALPLIRETAFFGFSSKALILVGAAVSLTLCVLAFLARYAAYTRAYSDHLRVVTPLLRFNISYRRMRSAYPVLFQQLFPATGASWSQRKFLGPLYGKTAVIVELKGYPIEPKVLKLFLPPQMLSPRSTGLVILVPDWMKFSTELDTLHGNWLQTQSKKVKS